MALSSADHDVLGARLSQRTCLGLVAQIVRATTNRLSPTHAVPRRLPQFETSGISQPFWPRARQRNCMPIHQRDLRGLRDRWSRGCEKSDDRIVGRRLTNSSRLRDRTCEQFVSRYLSPAAVNFQNREESENEDRCNSNTEQRLAARS